MSVSVESSANSATATVVLLPEHVHMGNAQDVLAALLPALQQSLAPVHIDASEVKRLDSALIAVLLACQRTVDEKKLPLTVVNAPAQLFDLIQLYGASTVLRVQRESLK